MKAAIALLAAALALAGCSRGTLVSTSNVQMVVEARSDVSRRFSVTLVEQIDGVRWSDVRIGSGKRRRCAGGPTNLFKGRSVLVAVETYRDDDTGALTRYIDRADLRRRFC